MAETTTEMDPRLAEQEEADEAWAHETPGEAGLVEDDDVDYARIRKHVIQRDGKPYIQYVGLLDLLHQKTRGNFSLHTHLVQAPTAENGMLAIVEARVEILPVGDEKAAWGNSLRTACGLGDASPGSVNRMMAPHLVRMAETRAKGRALRDLLNVPYVTTEELGPDGPVRDDRRPAGRSESHGFALDGGTGEVEGITIEGRLYTRDQVWGFYQQRAQQCRDRNLPIPQPMLNRNVPLPTIVDKTQEMKRTLAAAGALAPAGDQGRP